MPRVPPAPLANPPKSLNPPNLANPTPKAPADKREVLLASLPPGRRVAASEIRLFVPPFIACQIALPTFSPSNPSRNPSANDFPMSTPSATAPPASTPSRARMPFFSPVPRPSPISDATFAIFSLPDVCHHSVKGCAMISSQAIFTLPKKSAFCHSGPADISANLVFSPAIFSSTVSIKSSMAFSTAGICNAIQSTMPRTYGDSLSPKDSFSPPTALCSFVSEPFRLSIIVSAISLATPSQFLIAAVTFSISEGAAFIKASHPDMASSPAMVLA